MVKIKRFFPLFLILTLCLSLLLSCTVNDDEDENDELPVGQYVWAEDDELTVIIGDEANGFIDRFDFLGLAAEIDAFTATKVAVKNDAMQEAAHELVIGDTTRDISKYAQTALDDINTISVDSASYVIYAKNGSLAAAYDSYIGFLRVIDVLREIGFGKKTLSYEDGIVARENFSVSDYADEIREAERAEYFAAVEEELGKETVKALQKLYSLYDAENYIWMANLWDPENGGFYYSNSGRDNLGYLPDLESTKQILASIENGGMFPDYENETVYPQNNTAQLAFSQEWRDSIVKFVKEMQSDADGFFYHPQWGNEVTENRRSRDLAWAEALLERMGAKPYWTTPGGVKGERGAVGASYLTTPMASSSVTAVSRVVATATSSLPAHLQSVGAWKIYLEGLGIYGNSYETGNLLASQVNAITNADKQLWYSQTGKTSGYSPRNPAEDGYIETFMNHITLIQNKETGLWDDDVDYGAINGLMKLGSACQSFRQVIPNCELTLESIIKILAQKPEEDGVDDLHMCNTYNMWVCFGLLIDAANLSDNEALKEQVIKRVREEAPNLINVTYEKVKTHDRENGGFSYFEYALCNTSQDARVGCASAIEADVNATTIATTGIANSIATALGISKIPLYCAVDGYYFVQLVEGFGEVIKDDIPEVETVTFDDYDEAYGNEENGVVRYPDLNAIHKTPDETMDEQGNYKFYASAVVDDPYPNALGDKAYMVESKLYGEQPNREYASSMSGTYFAITNSIITGDTYTFSTDILVESVDNNVFAQFFMGKSIDYMSNTFSLNFNAYTLPDGKQYIRIWDNYEGTDGEKETIVSGIPVGEWFNFKVELYKMYTQVEGNAKKDLDVIAKIFINGEFVGTSESCYVTESGLVADRGVGAAGFGYYRSCATVLYLDNVRAEKFDTEYEPSYLPPDPVPEYIPTLEGNKGEGAYYNSCKAGTVTGKVWDYNNGEKKPSLSNELSAKIYMLENEDGSDRYVYFYRDDNVSNEKISFAFPKLSETDSTENLVAINEFDIAFGNAKHSWFSELEFIFGGKLAHFYLTGNADGEIKFEYMNESDRFVPLAQNTWYNLRFETYLVDDQTTRTKVYLNGEYFVEVNGMDIKEYSGANFAIQLSKTDKNTWICIDNIYTGYKNEEYREVEIPVPENLPTPSYSKDAAGNNITLGTGAYYSGAAVGTRVHYTDGKRPSLATSGTCAKTYVTVDKALYFYRTKSGSNEQLKYDVPALPENTENLVGILEMDIALGRIDNMWSTVIDFYGNGKRVGIYLGSSDITNNIVFSSNRSLDGFAQDTWYNLRFEIFYTDTETALVKVYVNGVYIGDTQGLDYKDSTNHRCLLAMNLTDDGYAMIDNVYVGWDNKAYPDDTTVPDGTTDPDDSTGDDPVTPPVDSDTSSDGDGDSGESPTVPGFDSSTEPGDIDNNGTVDDDGNDDADSWT